MSIIQISNFLMTRVLIIFLSTYRFRSMLAVAVLFCRENHFLLIDEPTNHLDIEARRKVGNYLRSKKGFILVSHDQAFCEKIKTKDIFMQ